MNKQQYADKWSLKEWQTLCKYQDFVEEFWNDDFERCDEIAADLRSMDVFVKI